MIRSLAVIGCTTLLSLMPVMTNAQADEVQHSALHDYRVDTHIDGLDRPWGMEFLPDGRLLITEKSGALRIAVGDQLLAEAVTGLPEIYTEGQAGLLDVALHPDFASNRWVYLTYSRPLEDDESTTAVIRGELNGMRLESITTIFEAVSRGRGHYGSRMSFDENGHIYISVGDRQAPPKGDLESHPSQDLSDHHGVILRLRDDGTIPGDNPFFGRDNARPEIWSYGHRNPQGMVYDAGNERLWITEHGPQGGDELNLIEAGKNYGWPVIGYGVNYGKGKTIHPVTHKDGMEQPVHFWVPSTGVAGLELYNGDAFPNWRGAFLAGGLANEQVSLLHMNGKKVVREETLPIRMGRVRDVTTGPEGFIYLAIDGDDNTGTILKLTPVERAEVMMTR